MISKRCCGKIKYAMNNPIDQETEVPVCVAN